MREPDSARVAFDAALRAHRAGDLAGARAAYERFLEEVPGHASALANLGSVCRQLGDVAAALRHLSRALALAPDHAGAHYNLGNLHRAQGDLARAIAAYRDSLACARSAAQRSQAAYNLALSLAESGAVEAAEDAYRAVLAEQPEHLEAAMNLAVLLAGQGRLGEARARHDALRRAHPSDGRILTNLSNVALEAGDVDGAIDALDAAVALQPELPQPRSNRLMALQYRPGVRAAELLRAAVAWGRWAEAQAGAPPGEAPRRRLPETGRGRPLRVGYVSADLYMHPVGLFVAPVVPRHDPGACVPFLYDNGSRRDGLHRSLVRGVERLGGAVRAVDGLDDAALARRVEHDRIDVLVDLSGHTGRSRLAAFACRPAPVQISWLGYFATTGLAAIDFVLLDPHHAPAGTQAQFTERIVRLPHNRFCYAAPAFAPPVAPSPCSSTGVITFGSFNNTAKLNGAVLEAWARILEQVPASRLILKWRAFADAAYRERVRAVFAQRRVDPARLELRPMSGHRELLHEYADIDIALDPFPFSGGQTSCEALWMGVPVVTLPQERMVSRQTFSFLANIGLTELAAADPEDYVRIAVSLAGDTARLGSLRACLRSRMAASPLCDAPGFVRALEGAYRLAWDTVRREGTPGRSG